MGKNLSSETVLACGNAIAALKRADEKREEDNGKHLPAHCASLIRLLEEFCFLRMPRTNYAAPSRWANNEDMVLTCQENQKNLKEFLEQCSAFLVAIAGPH